MRYEYSKDQVLNLRVNQVGFLPRAPKFFVLQGGEAGQTFQVLRMQDCQWTPVFEGKLEIPAQEEIEDGCAVGEFTGLTAPGIYRVRCGMAESRCFTIDPACYDSVERMLCLYYEWQRCNDDLGWHGRCHSGDRVVRADGSVRSLAGGHHQSGDLRKWAWGTAQGITGLARYGQTARTAWDQGRVAYDLRKNADYFLALISPEGYFYDCTFVPEDYDDAACHGKGVGDYDAMWKPRLFFDRPAVGYAHWYAVKSLSEEAAYFRAQGDAEYAEKCVEGARRLWDWMLAGGEEGTENYDWPVYPPLGHDDYHQVYFRHFFKNSAGMLGLKTVAAAALYRARADETVARQGRESLKALLTYALRDPRGRVIGFRQSLTQGKELSAEFPSDYLQLSFVCALEAWPDSPDAPAWRDCALDLADRLCDIASRNAYGKATSDLEITPPGVTGAQVIEGAAEGVRYKQYPYCYNRDLSLSAILLLKVYRLLGQPRHLAAAQRLLDWELGVNPFDASSVEGVGYHQPHRGIFGEFAPPVPQIPGAVVTGIFPGDFSTASFGMAAEYDMAMAGFLLYALRLLRQACEASESEE